MKHLKDLYVQCQGKPAYFQSYFSYLNEVLTAIDSASISSVVDCFLAARENNRTIFFAGNGGSASTASHFAQDLGEVGRKANKPGFRTLSLTDNISLLSAIGNDYGFDKIFSVQLSEMFIPGDVLVAISASGNSPNVVNAVEFAKEAGGRTVGLVGFDGGKMKHICDHVIHVETDIGAYGPAEDAHMVMDHLITSYMILKLSDND
jgi:D-sedoheptulose 7-phosphate isomerase